MQIVPSLARMFHGKRTNGELLGLPRTVVVLGVVNFDYHATQSGAIELDLEALGLDQDAPFEVVEMLDDETYTWRGAQAWVELDPEVRAAHLFWLRHLP